MHAGHRERLRERFAQQGLAGFTDHQALELLLTFSIPRKDTGDLARQLMDRYGSLSKVLDADAADLASVSGIGGQSAVLLALAGQLVRRVKRETPAKRPRLNTAAAAGAFACRLLWRKKHETFYVFCLDKRRYLLHAEQAQEGTVGEAVVYPRQIVEVALRHGAQGVILAHNHPSGDCGPSPQDRETTESVRAVLAGIGISLHDHIITGDDCFFSLASLRRFDIRETPEKSAADERETGE